MRGTATTHINCVMVLLQPECLRLKNQNDQNCADALADQAQPAPTTGELLLQAKLPLASLQEAYTPRGCTHSWVGMCGEFWGLLDFAVILHQTTRTVRRMFVCFTKVQHYHAVLLYTYGRVQTPNKFTWSIALATPFQTFSPWQKTSLKVFVLYLKLSSELTSFR